MAGGEFYRGGSSLVPHPDEVKVDQASGLLRTSHGVSVFDRPENLERFGGPYRVTNVPAELRVIQRGRDPHHHEIVPAHPMTMTEFEEALRKIILIPV